MIAGVDGRTAIVGGSSSGLGYAVAELLARSGARVMVVSRSKERVTKAVDSIRAAGGAAVEGCAADFTEEGAPAAVVAATCGVFGQPEIVVANGGGPPGMPATSATAGDPKSGLGPLRRYYFDRGQGTGSGIGAFKRPPCSRHRLSQECFGRGGR
jgi:3-oxoacyl-[acyl-carrier protein] reductase